MKYFSKLFIVVLLMIITINQLKAGKTDANIVGHVLCENEHIPYVNVIIKGTTIGTLTNATGQYMLTNIPIGKHTIIIRGIGYKTNEKEVEIIKGQTIELNFEIEQDLINMEGIVVTANRNEISRKDAAVVVNVINPKLFDITSSISLSEGLNFTPGLRMENNCQNCGFSQLRMNGLEGSYSQILINSRPIFSSLAGVYGLEQIPANMIERVEVIRGGGSALYGGNAIAGTVNIITKDPINNTFQIGTNTALIDGDALDASVTFNGSIVTEDLKSGIFVFGLLRNRDYWDANGDSYSEVAELKNNSFGFMAHHRPGERSKISLDFYNLNEYRRGGNKFDFKPHFADIAEQTEHSLLGTNVSYEQYSKNSKQKFSVYTSGQYLDRDSYYGANKDPNAYGRTTELSVASGFQYSINFDKLFFAPATLTAGSEYSVNKLKDEKLGEVENLTIEDHTVGNLGVYAQNEWELKKIKFLVGMRYDKNDLLNNAVFSPRANVLFKLAKGLQFRTSYSQGFRSPQIFNEDLHIEVSGAKGVYHRNAKDLKKETSESFSASFDLTKDFKKTQTYFLVEGFYTILNNPFVHEYTIADDSSGFIYHERRNGSGSLVKGINFEAKIAPSSKLNFQMGFTIQSSTYKENEIIWEPESGNSDSIVSTKNISRSPKAYGYFVLSYKIFKDFTASTTANYTSSMLAPHMIGAENDYTILEETPEFFDLGIKLAYDIKLSKETYLQLNAGVQNVFNSFQKDFDIGILRDAGYVYGPIKPRTFFVGLKLGNILP